MKLGISSQKKKVFLIQSFQTLFSGRTLFSGQFFIIIEKRPGHLSIQPDIVMECTGAEQAVSMALLAAANGGKVSLSLSPFPQLFFMF